MNINTVLLALVLIVLLFGRDVILGPLHAVEPIVIIITVIITVLVLGLLVFCVVGGAIIKLYEAVIKLYEVIGLKRLETFLRDSLAGLFQPLVMILIFITAPALLWPVGLLLDFLTDGIYPTIGQLQTCAIFGVILVGYIGLVAYVIRRKLAKKKQVQASMATK